MVQFYSDTHLMKTYERTWRVLLVISIALETLRYCTHLREYKRVPSKGCHMCLRGVVGPPHRQELRWDPHSAEWKVK